MSLRNLADSTSNGVDHEGDAGLIAVFFQVFEFAFPEGVVLFEQLVLARSRLFAGVPVGRGMLGGEGPRLVGLEFDGRPRRRGRLRR